MPRDLLTLPQLTVLRGCYPPTIRQKFEKIHDKLLEGFSFLDHKKFVAWCGPHACICKRIFHISFGFLLSARDLMSKVVLGMRNTTVGRFA
jgi:hypothetical protein